MCVTIIDLNEKTATVKIFSEIITDDKQSIALRLHETFCNIAKMQRRQSNDLVKKELQDRLNTIESVINALEIKEK